MPKEKYIIDKNCFYHASKRQDHKNNPDYEAYLLFGNILNHCDKVVFDGNLMECYHKILNELRDSHLLSLWNEYLTIQAKTLKWCEHVKIKDDKDIKLEDRVLVSLARSSQATLITGDLKLIEVLDPNQDNQSERFKIKVLTPKKANFEISRNILKDEDTQKTNKKQDVKKISKKVKI